MTIKMVKNSFVVNVNAKTQLEMIAAVNINHASLYVTNNARNREYRSLLTLPILQRSRLQIIFINSLRSCCFLSTKVCYEIF
jgi:hypothetical protein